MYKEENILVRPQMIVTPENAFEAALGWGELLSPTEADDYRKNQYGKIDRPEFLSRMESKTAEELAQLDLTMEDLKELRTREPGKPYKRDIHHAFAVYWNGCKFFPRELMVLFTAEHAGLHALLNKVNKGNRLLFWFLKSPYPAVMLQKHLFKAAVRNACEKFLLTSQKVPALPDGFPLILQDRGEEYLNNIQKNLWTILSDKKEWNSIFQGREYREEIRRREKANEARKRHWEKNNGGMKVVEGCYVPLPKKGDFPPRLHETRSGGVLLETIAALKNNSKEGKK